MDRIRTAPLLCHGLACSASIKNDCELFTRDSSRNSGWQRLSTILILTTSEHTLNLDLGLTKGFYKIRQLYIFAHSVLVAARVMELTRWCVDAVFRLLGVCHDFLYGDYVTKCAGQKTSSKQDERKAGMPWVG